MNIYIINIIIITVISCLIYYVLNKTKRKKNIIEWMNLSSGARNKLFFKENIKTMKRKKALIDKIRKEYFKLKQK